MQRVITNSLRRPSKISVVVVSVNYGPVLSNTLAKNSEILKDFVVVTTKEDAFTRNVAADFGVKTVISNRCYEDGDSFNKGKMLNDGILAIENPDWILCTDADILFHNDTRNLLSLRLDQSCLYYTNRIDLHAVRNQSPSVNNEPNGFFQLFHAEAEPVRTRWPQPMSESFCSAGGVDTWFYLQWDLRNIKELPEIPVTHIPSRFFGENWNGLVPKPGSWVQIGFLDRSGIVTFEELTFTPKQVRLTDLLCGESVVTDIDDIGKYVSVSSEGLEFLGRSIGDTAIHVACRLPSEKSPAFVEEDREC